MQQIMKRAEGLAKQKRYVEAFDLLREAARENIPMANYALGTWYLHGRHVEKDIKKGFQYLTKASKGDIGDAFFDLGVCYEKGLGTEKNLGKAFECYVRAANLGDKDALYEVMRCLYYGIGVSKNTQLAALFYTRYFKPRTIESVAKKSPSKSLAYARNRSVRTTSKGKEHVSLGR